MERSYFWLLLDTERLELSVAGVVLWRAVMWKNTIAALCS